MCLSGMVMHVPMSVVCVCVCIYGVFCVCGVLRFCESQSEKKQKEAKLAGVGRETEDGSVKESRPISVPFVSYRINTLISYFHL